MSEDSMIAEISKREFTVIAVGTKILFDVSYLADLVSQGRM